MRWLPSQRWRAVVVTTGMAVAMLAVAVVGLRGDATRPASSTSTSTTVTPSTSGSATTSTTTATTASTAPTTSPTQPTTTTTTTEAAPAVVIRQGSSDRPVVALTFDAGSDTGYAAKILDTLAANGVLATFGMTGRWAEANPALLRRMVAEGHQLVNHSYDHPSFTGYSTGAEPLSRAERLDQLARTEAAVLAATGATTKPWFRPPYGDEDASVRIDVALAGYRYEVMWTVDSLGWKGVAADEVVRRCLDGAVPGAIYLLHVGAASTDYAALQQVIDGLAQRGYGFVTVATLVAG